MENKELFILYLSRHLTSLDVFASSFKQEPIKFDRLLPGALL